MYNDRVKGYEMRYVIGMKNYVKDEECVWILSKRSGLDFGNLFKISMIGNITGLFVLIYYSS